MFRTFSSVLILMAGALAAFGRHPKVDKDLENLNPESSVNVIIQYKQPPTAAHHRKVADKGGHHKRTLDLINGGLYAMPGAKIAELADDPGVERISLDHVVRSTAYNGKLDYGWMTVTGVSSPSGKLPYDGTGVGVAVLDSGLDPVPDIPSIAYRQSFVPNDTSTNDGWGHGTHVAGILAGNGSMSACSDCFYRIRGIAPKVKLVVFRVLDANGVGTDSAVIAAINRAIALRATYNIRVMNLSLGRPVTGPYASDPLCQAVEKAWKAGIVVVVAAGNEGRNNSLGTSGYATITAPGNDPYVITVGAMNTQGSSLRPGAKIASYSSKGPSLLDHMAKPDLVAPGNAILSNRAYNVGMEALYPANIVPTWAYSGGSYEPDYFQLSGTSMAAPMVSGAAALLIQKTPSLTPDQVKARLMRTASKTFPYSSTATDPATGTTYTSQYDIFAVGAGYLDIPAALNDTTPVTGTALSPAVTYDPVNKKVSLAFANGVVWGDGLVWGTGIVWGNGVVWGTGIVWGSGVVWGTGGNPSGNGIVWGDAVVWGTGTPAGEATAIAINGEN